MDTKQPAHAEDTPDGSAATPEAGAAASDADAASASSAAETVISPAATPLLPQSSAASKLRKAQVRAALFRKMEPIRIGRFVLLEQLGAGGMGEIYAAYDDQLDRKVALKLVRGGAEGSIKADERLLREAQALAKLSHPNVVQIYEAGTFGGKVFIAMELIRGKTLSSWLEDAAQVPRALRGREILRQFIAAGRGLEAAHAAGVAHRDFKPDNVLVGDDGRVRVVDFGLARAVDEPDPGALASAPASASARSGREPGAASPISFATGARTIDHAPASSAPRLEAALRLTEPGTVMGTPRFMAPEQMRGAVADHRSDQFSFCVALYHALCDEFPFSGESWQELEASMKSGEVRTMPGAPAPSFVRKALRRGLAVEPSQRFASMGELLAALEPRGRRLRGSLAAVAGAIAIALVAVVALRAEAPADPCAAAGRAIDAPWSAERQAALRAAFRGSELPFAEPAWRGLKARVDAYASRWRDEATAACRATSVERTQSAQQLDKRVLCLDRGRRQLAALLTELGDGAPGAVEHAIEAAEALPALEACGDARSLLFGLEPPPAPVAARVAALRDQLARAFTLGLLGRSEEALAIAREASATAGGLGYPPVHAEALVQTARAVYERGTAEARGEAERLYFEALDLAEAERHDELAARIWHLLVRLAVDGGKDQALAWWRRNEASVRRLGGDAYEQAKLHHIRGEIHYREGKYAQAADEQRRAIAAIERAPAHRLELSRYYDALARSLAPQDELDEAIRLHGQARAVAEEALGAGHPIVVTLQANHGLTLVQRGQLDRAGEVLEGALASMSARDRGSHRQAAKIHSFLSSRYYLAGQLDRAAEHGRASLEVHQRAGSADPDVAEVLMKLADLEFKRRAFDAALALYERARALRRHLEGHYHLGLTEGCIAETLFELGRHEEAMPHLEAAERIFERGVSRVNQAWILTVRGELLAGQRRFGEALPVLERALGLFGDGEVDPTNHALAMGTLARALHELGKDGSRVRSLAERARAIFAAQGEVGAHHRDAIARFIDRLPARRAPPAP